MTLIIYLNYVASAFFFASLLLLQLYNICHSLGGYNRKQQCCPVPEPLTPMASFPPASHMMGNTPAAGQLVPVMQQCKALIGEGHSNAALLWMSALPGSWNRGTRQQLLHMKSSSLLPGYFCHMLVFTAFLLLLNNCTHSIYSTACMQTDQCLLYMQ